MATYQLLSASASPFARKVRVAVIEAGLGDEIDVIDTPGIPTEPDARRVQVNPLGKVPALVRPDGPALFDSRVITRYIDARAEAGLYPAGSLWEVLTLEALADGVMEAALLMVYEHRCRPAELVSTDWLSAQWDKVERALDAVEDRWTGHLSGRVTAAQIALGCALGYLDFRHSGRDWRQGRDSLAAWERGFSERPSMFHTRPA